MTLLSAANNFGSDTELTVSGEGHLYILRTTEALELILWELHASLCPRKKISAVLGDFTSTFCLLVGK
jgi:hypothetical protein